MDAYATEKKISEEALKLESDENDLTSLVVALQSENARLKAQILEIDTTDLDVFFSDDEEESKEESKAPQRGDLTPF